MRVYDEITKEFCPREMCTRVMVDHIPGQVIFGYVSSLSNIVSVIVNTSNGNETVKGDKELLKDHLEYSQYRGIYISTIDFPEESLIVETNIKGMGGFPYSFSRRYEAIENFHLFTGAQEVLDTTTNYTLSKYMKYTFGLEFETSMGYIPEDLCFRDGLIPLRDGSISGLEYSTVILEGNNGISLLKQQLETLEKYTAFNKECSLHIHMGGYPLDPTAIFRAQNLCRILEKDIVSLVPELTFNSAAYKANGKNYCTKLCAYGDFNDMYRSLVGRPFYGDLSQPHPCDIERKAKWKISTRYNAVNFINMLCYDVNKTIEFRFLRPTYNFNKILVWLYIFNAILAYAEDAVNTINNYVTLRVVLSVVYPSELYNKVLIEIEKLRALRACQERNGDSIGRDTEFERSIFSSSSLY